MDLDCLKFFLITPNETTHGHCKLFVRRSCVEVRKYFFGNRVVKICQFGIACQQQWKILPVCESLNPSLSVLTCRSM